MTTPDVIQLILTSQEQIRSEIGKLARVTSAQGARLGSLDNHVSDLKLAVNRVHQYTVECPARGGWQTLKEDISEIRVMTKVHDRELAESQGYRASEMANRSSKKRNSLTSWGPGAPLSVSLAIRDPKFWGKVIFYSLVAAAASFGLATNLR